MANLLPPEVKVGIQKNYRVRITVVTLFTTAVLIVAALVMLIPSFILVDNQEKALESLTDTYVKSEVGQGDSDPISILEETEEKIGVLAKERVVESVPYDIIARVLKHKNESTTITQLSYLQKVNEKNDELAVVSIDGVSEDRESLQDFVAKLRTEAMFSEIEDPYQNYIESTHLEYGLVIHVVKGND